MKTWMKALGAVVLAGALPACGGSDHDDAPGEGSFLYPLFFWLNFLGGARSADGGPATVEIGGGVDGAAEVVEVRWHNDTTGEQGLAQGTSSWTARVPVVPGANAVTVTACDAAGRLASSTRRVVYDDQGVRFAEPE